MKNIKDAIDHLSKTIKEDESYRMVWKSNIAMAFQDTFNELHRHKGVHFISNEAAERFLNLLFKDNTQATESEGK